MPKEWYYHPQLRKSNGDYYTQYFESSHAEFLQAAGARVVPIDYQLSRIELKAKLEQLNGFYIAGDTKESYLNAEYQYAVVTVLSWAQQHNSVEEAHFPVVSMGYGFAAMLESQFLDKHLFPMPSDMVARPLQQNLNLLPKQTFTYDEVPDIESLLDQVTFYNDIDVGIQLDQFN